MRCLVDFIISFPFPLYIFLKNSLPPTHHTPPSFHWMFGFVWLIYLHLIHQTKHHIFLRGYIWYTPTFLLHNYFSPSCWNNFQTLLTPAIDIILKQLSFSLVINTHQIREHTLYFVINHFSDKISFKYPNIVFSHVSTFTNTHELHTPIPTLPHPNDPCHDFFDHFSCRIIFTTLIFFLMTPTFLQPWLSRRVLILQRKTPFVCRTRKSLRFSLRALGAFLEWSYGVVVLPEWGM